jgi:hypothetical protein
MTDLYEVAKRHREELVREAEVTRLAKGSGQPANGVPA